jgi:hypothetical protein
MVSGFQHLRPLFSPLFWVGLYVFLAHANDSTALAKTARSFSVILAMRPCARLETKGLHEFLTEDLRHHRTQPAIAAVRVQRIQDDPI